MSTFSLSLMLLFLIVFGIQFFMYFVNIEMPRFSGFLTLVLLLMLTAEVMIAVFELPAKLIDIIIYVSMGNRMITLCFGVAVSMVLLFIIVKIFLKIHWKNVLTFTPLKYVVLGGLVIMLSIYTELFNGSYSFDSMKEYNAFKQNFAKYDEHFWPTKYIKDTGQSSRRRQITYSIYPWDVEITDGRQFVYKVVTFYATDDDEENNIKSGDFCYYPFTYHLYTGVSPMPVEYEKITTADPLPTVSESDTDEDDEETTVTRSQYDYDDEDEYGEET